MNVGIIVDNDLNNDKRVLREIKILRQNSYEIFVLCFGFNKKGYNRINHIKITRINISKRIKNVLFFVQNLIPIYEYFWSSRISKFIKSNQLEVLHVHDLYMSKAARSGITRSTYNIPMILDLHENFAYAITTYNWTRGLLRSFLSKPWKWESKEHEYLGYADRIIVLSEEYKSVLLNKYQDLNQNIITVLPNVPDLTEQEMDLDLPARILFKKTVPVIFYFGVIAERRGIFDTLEVFTEIVKETNPAQLLLVGPVDKKDKARFFRLIENEIFKGRIIYIPWIDLSELPAYLQASDICIAPFHKNPQHESGVANKIFDYMLGRKPVIASDCKPQKRIIEQFDCGIIFENKIEYKNAILKLLKDSLSRQKMGENGYNAVVLHYNLTAIKQNLINIYHTL